MKHLILIRKVPILLSLVMVIVTSCTSIRLISEYDEITDKTVTALQEKVAAFFVKISDQVGSNQANYANHIQFYEDAKVDLNILKTRADAIDKNKIVQEQIAELTKMVNNLETLHKIGFSNREQLMILQQPFNSAFTAIIKLQLGLKRGEK